VLCVGGLPEIAPLSHPSATLTLHRGTPPCELTPWLASEIYRNPAYRVRDSFAPLALPYASAYCQASQLPLLRASRLYTPLSLHTSIHGESALSASIYHQETSRKHAKSIPSSARFLCPQHISPTTPTLLISHNCIMMQLQFLPPTWAYATTFITIPS
jgi:hypothetical protein